MSRIFSYTVVMLPFFVIFWDFGFNRHQHSVSTSVYLSWSNHLDRSRLLDDLKRHQGSCKILASFAPTILLEIFSEGRTPGNIRLHVYCDDLKTQEKLVKKNEAKIKKWYRELFVRNQLHLSKTPHQNFDFIYQSNNMSPITNSWKLKRDTWKYVAD